MLHPTCTCSQRLNYNRVMETMQSAVGHPFPTQQPFNHRRTLGTMPHYIYQHLYVSERRQEGKKDYCVCLARTHISTYRLKCCMCLCFGWDTLHWGKYKSKEWNPYLQETWVNMRISIVMDLNWSNKRVKWRRDWPLIAPFLLIPSWASWYKGSTLMKD